MENRKRKGTRLQGFDYSQPAEYFVTICTKGHACSLGEVVDGVMVLSEAGKIVDGSWKGIPTHFPATRVDVFRIMPNHVHGIIEIVDIPKNLRKSCRGLINQTPTDACRGWPLMAQSGIPLGKIVRSFKARSCRLIHESGLESFAWQRNYHDRIIRSDLERFHIERYIELNPLLWCFDPDNMTVHAIPLVELERVLKHDHGLDEHTTRYLLDRVADGRALRDGGDAI